MLYVPYGGVLIPYIELTGPPGCGKTTIAGKLLKQCPDLYPGRRSLARTISDRGHCLTVFGFPVDGKNWISIFSFIWLDVFYSLLFSLQCRGVFWVRIKKAFLFFNYLIKARALKLDKRLWIVDQGIVQHILSCLARNDIDEAQADFLMQIAGKKKYTMQRIFWVRVEKSTVINRVKHSLKHLEQTANMSPEAYAAAYVNACDTIRLLIDSRDELQYLDIYG